MCSFVRCANSSTSNAHTWPRKSAPAQKKLASRNRVEYAYHMSTRNEWGTPWYIFVPLHARYGFTVDACACAWNAKLPHYWMEDEDGLAQDWSHERVWCNPPYGKGLIEPWITKAITTKFARRCGAMLLLPSRTDTVWFQRLLKDYAIQFLPKRVRFVPPTGIQASSPTEASILVKVGIE